MLHFHALESLGGSCSDGYSWFAGLVKRFLLRHVRTVYRSPHLEDCRLGAADLDLAIEEDEHNEEDS